MKWITPIWSDPIGWSEKVAKTKVRVVLWSLMHLGFVFAGFYFIEKFVRMELPPGLDWLAVVHGGMPILFIGVFYPTLYLYAMHKLLKIIRERETLTAEQAN